jgi:hypothetical protein
MLDVTEKDYPFRSDFFKINLYAVFAFFNLAWDTETLVVKLPLNTKMNI